MIRYELISTVWIKIRILGSCTHKSDRLIRLAKLKGIGPWNEQPSNLLHNKFSVWIKILMIGTILLFDALGCTTTFLVSEENRYSKNLFLFGLQCDELCEISKVVWYCSAKIVAWCPSIKSKYIIFYNISLKN